MPPAKHRLDFDATARQWLTLAERRLLDLGDLYHSGHWIRYYESKREFATEVLATIKVAKIWARMAGARRIADAKDHEHPAA